MSVAIVIKFKTQARKNLYVPVATEGTYSSEWVALARKLGLRWLPLFHAGTDVEVAELPAVMDEFRRLRAALVGNPGKADLVERLDFILETLGELNPDELAEIFVG